MRNYHGERTKTGTRVWWEDDDGDGIVNIGELSHQVLHSPDGFEWGYAGSGPADLARSLLWDVTGHEPEPVQYQTFKENVVAGWKTNNWSINDASIMAWLNKFDVRSEGHRLQDERRGFGGVVRRMLGR